MPCNELLGDDLKLYWDDADDFDSPNWEEQINIGDLSFDDANEQVEMPKRISTKVYKKGRADWELTFTMTVDPDNEFHARVLANKTSGDRIHLAVALGDISTEQYWHAWWLITGPLDGSLDSPATVEVTAKCHANLGEYCDEYPAHVVPT